MIPRIQRDLFDFVDHDPEDRAGLIEFWYSANAEPLSAALTQAPGLSLILNVSTFDSFERLSKKLFLVADTLILRDTRKWTKEENAFREIPIPQDYKPGYWDELASTLQQARPSPLTLLYRPKLYSTSHSKDLNNGYHVNYAAWDYNSIPDEFVKWIAGPGRPYFETGRMVYAPFIPPLEVELELLKNHVPLPEYFNATPCFHQNYDWLDTNSIDAMLSLQVPFLDGLDIGTIAKVKEDNRDEFEAFSRSLLNAVAGVKASFGTDGFVREVRYIQRNQIDAGLSDVQKTIAKVSASSSLRKQSILAGLIGLNAAILMGAAAPAIATGLAAAAVAFVADKLAQMKERHELRDRSQYFLWKLKESATPP